MVDGTDRARVLNASPRIPLTVLLGERFRPGTPLRDTQWHRLSDNCAVAVPAGSRHYDCTPAHRWDPCARIEPLIALLRRMQSKRVVLDLSGNASPAAVMADVLQDDLLGPLLRLDGVLYVERRASTGTCDEAHRALADRVVAMDDIRVLADLPSTGLMDTGAAQLLPDRWLPECEARTLVTHALSHRDLLAWLAELQATLGGHCLRLKAIIKLRDATHSLALHALHGRFQAPVILKDIAGSVDSSRIRVVTDPAWRAAADRCVDQLEAFARAQPIRPPSTMRLVAVQ